MTVEDTAADAEKVFRRRVWNGGAAESASTLAACPGEDRGLTGGPDQTQKIETPATASAADVADVLHPGKQGSR